MNFRNWVAGKIVEGQYNLIIKALIKIAQDLQNLHKQGHVHMDLKDDNVLVINDEAFVSDFGKVESDGKVIPSANRPFMRYDTNIKKFVPNYPQLAPEYFLENSKNPFYTVCYTFDLYSYGFLMKSVSRMMKNSNTKYKGELSAISTYTHRINVKERKSLADVIIYLNKLL
jgi:serine/threonine protein kinase